MVCDVEELVKIRWRHQQRELIKSKTVKLHSDTKMLRLQVFIYWYLSLALFHQEVVAFVPQSPAQQISSRSVSTRPSTSTSARWNGMWNRDSELEGANKVKACIPYMLPILDGDHFGKYLYDRIPPLGLVHDALLGGLLHIWDIFPFSGLTLFIALTLGTRGNTEMDRNVRFSAQQAGLIDVSLIVPELIAGSFEGDDTVPRSILEPCSNFTYYYLICVITYCIVNNLRGKKPDGIPYISGYSEMMVGPF